MACSALTMRVLPLAPRHCRGMASGFPWHDYPAVPLKLVRGGRTEPGVRNDVVVLHGMLGCGINWGTLIGKMGAGSGRGLITPDMRNHGGSPWSQRCSYLDLASDVLQLIRERAEAPITLMGHSMGARTAMTLSLLMNEQDRSLIKDLVIVDASPIHKTTKAGISFMKKLFTALKAADITSIPADMSQSEAKAVMNSRLEEAGVSEESMRSWLLMNLSRSRGGEGYNWLFNMEVLSEQLDSLTSVPEQKRWQPFGGQVLFIGGERSGYIPKSAHDDIRVWFPKAEFDYVANAGHWVHADNPKGYLEAVLPFLNNK